MSARLDGPVVLVLSPHAGHAGRGDEVERTLRAAGVTVGERLMVSELDTQRPLGSTWRQSGFSAGIAAGGDGTVGAVVSHLDGSGLPLGILPLGTSNDTARSLGVPLDLHDAAQVIAAGCARPVDAGQAIPALTAPLALADDAAHAPLRAGTGAPTPALGAYFLHALTLGFNVEFARLATDVARRERLGNLNYAVSLLQTLATFRPVEVTIRFSGAVEPSTARAGAAFEDRPDTVVTCVALALAAVNTPVFGGTWNLRVPDVHIHDRLLDFVVIETLDLDALRATLEAALAALARLPGEVQDRTSASPTTLASDQEIGLALPGIHRYKARAAVIESARPLDVTLDGDVRARTPVYVRVAPYPIPILLPRAPRSGIPPDC